MPNDIMDIVKDLRKKGLVQGVDFDFKYKPPEFQSRIDWTQIDVYNTRCTVFTFYKEELATWFQLKYQ